MVAVRQWLDSPGVVSASWFTQIVVNPVGQRVNRHEHSAWVTRRWRMALIAAGTPPAGRAERSGANAGKEVTFDPTDPDARDSFLNRLCEGAHPIRIALDLLDRAGWRPRATRRCSPRAPPRSGSWRPWPSASRRRRT